MTTQQKNHLILVKDSATGIAVASIIAVLAAYIPLLGFFFAVLLPMPILYYRLKLGRSPGGMIAAASFVAITALSGGLTIDMLFYGSLLITGFLLGHFLEKQLTIERTGILTCLTTLGVGIVTLFLYAQTTKQSILTMVSAYVAANLDLTLKVYQGMGMPQESIDLITSSIDTIHYVLVRILPSIVVAMLLFVIWANILFIKTVLKKKGLGMPRLENLNQWRAPDRLVWAVIVFGAFLVLPVNGLGIIGLNCIIVMMLIYFFQGIAIVSFFLDKRRFPVMLKVVLYTIIAVQQLFLVFIIALGFFDTWVNFRKIGRTKTAENNNS
ncbi:MAG: YybS family protein [Pseudomonadota bacterium]